MQVDNPSSRAGTLAFVIGFFIISALLLSQIGSETKFSSKGQLFAQPRTWPAIGISGMVLFSFAYVAANWPSRATGIGSELLGWIRPVEFLAWFMAYVSLVPIIGYLTATVPFTVLLALRLGYRQPKTLLLSAATGAAIVVIFKAGLSVKIPGGALYDYLPDAIRNFMIVNL